MPGNESSDPIIEALTNRLTEQTEEGFSSTPSNIEGVIGQAIANTRESGKASSEAIQIEREREVSAARDRGAVAFTSALEGRTGYATQVQAFKELAETTEKSVRDLDQRYQQSILQNDAETASQVANMQLQKLNFLMQQEQNLFSNLISTATLQESMTSREQQADIARERMTQEERLMKDKFDFDLSLFDKQQASEERNTLLALAAQNGVSVSENETIESMIEKVSPFVNERRRLELQQIKTDISLKRQQVNNAIAEGLGQEPLDETVLDGLALMVANDPNVAITDLAETQGQASQISQKVQKLQEQKDNRLQEIASSPVVTSPEAFANAVVKDPNIPINVTQSEIDRYTNLYRSKWEQNESKTQQGFRNPSTSISDSEFVQGLIEEFRKEAVAQRNN